ncbi:DUF6712 family protein [Bacteroides ovatus]|jgi:hypothetical protein|uniref:DUF6712 family protein n=1 Tax=Bacteroides ovatus TaxID=28116 RepID=UPI0020A766A1|nr:hypothetical protein [Bacteroides ovatus]
MQQHLITTEEVSELSRDMSTHLDKSKIETYIRESENIDIKSALGDGLFLDVKNFPEKYSILLNGGIYETECGDRKVFTGLKSALAYYTFARIVKNGDGSVTRFGFVNKESEYSSRSEIKEKVMAYNDAFSIADRYLKECVQYLNDCKSDFPLYKSGGKLKANRTVFRIIGD